MPRGLRRRVSVALDIRAWIDQRGLALADLAQEHNHDWIAGATSQRRHLIPVLPEADHGPSAPRELTVPCIPRQETQNLLDEDDRWPLLQRPDRRALPRTSERSARRRQRDISGDSCVRMIERLADDLDADASGEHGPFASPKTGPECPRPRQPRHAPWGCDVPTYVYRITKVRSRGPRRAGWLHRCGGPGQRPRWRPRTCRQLPPSPGVRPGPSANLRSPPASRTSAPPRLTSVRGS